MNMMPRTSFFLARVRRASWFGQLILLLVGTGLVVALGLVVIGFPNTLSQWFLAEMNKGDYFVQVRAVHLDWRGGLKAGNVSVYRKGIPGPPFLEMRECRILYHWFEAPRAGRIRVKEITATDGVVRPLWNSTHLGNHRKWDLNGATGSGLIKALPLKEVELDITLSNFDVLGVWVKRGKTSLRMDAEGLYLSRLSGKLGQDLHAGTIEGTLAWRNDGQVSGRVATAIDPHTLLPACTLLYPEASAILDLFSFPTDPPRLDITFEAATRPVLTLKAKGRFQATHYAYRGAVIGYANLVVDYVFGNGTNRVLIDPFSLAIHGRHARGRVDFDLNGRETSFAVDSEVNLASVLRIAGLKESFMRDWGFEEGTRVIARGRLGHAGVRDSEIEASVEGAEISYRGMTLSNYAFSYHGRGQTHSFSNVRGNAGGGSVSGSGVILPTPSAETLVGEINAQIINVDSEEIIKLVNTNLGWRVGGKLFGSLQFKGIGEKLTGQGQLTVRSVLLFKSPFGAGLLEEWGLSAQGLDLAETPAEARFSFDFKDNRIASRDVHADLGNIAMTAKGSCGMDGSLDWVVKPAPVAGNGAMRAVMALLKPFRPGEYSLTGTVKHPEWRPVSRNNRN